MYVYIYSLTHYVPALSLPALSLSSVCLSISLCSPCFQWSRFSTHQGATSIVAGCSRRLFRRRKTCLDVTLVQNTAPFVINGLYRHVL